MELITLVVDEFDVVTTVFVTLAPVTPELVTPVVIRVTVALVETEEVGCA